MLALRVPVDGLLYGRRHTPIAMMHEEIAGMRKSGCAASLEVPSTMKCSFESSCAAQSSGYDWAASHARSIAAAAAAREIPPMPVDNGNSVTPTLFQNSLAFIFI